MAHALLLAGAVGSARCYKTNGNVLSERPPTAADVLHNETVMVIDMYRYVATNPQHCWSDVIFPLLYRNQTRTKYILRADKLAYCAHTLTRLEIGAQLPFDQWFCFMESSVPGRFPRLNPSADQFAPTDFWDRVRARAASASRCGPYEPTTGHWLPNTDFTLVYDRGDTRRRRWLNPEPTVRLLKRSFGLPVYHLSSMTVFSPCEQAELLSRARVIVWPHGGHTANIVYCRPGARVVELMCGTPHSTGSINSGPYAANLGIWWRTVREPSCTNASNTHFWAYSPKSFKLSINVTDILLSHD